MDLYHLFQSLVLGILQGLAEFLPISSSGHLKIVPWFFGWETPGLVFDTSLHLGTSLALLLFFYKDFWEVIKGFVRPSDFKEKKEARDARMLGFYIIIGMLPAGILGLLFDKQIEFLLPEPLTEYSALVIAGLLAVFGLILYGVDRMNTRNYDMKAMNWQRALLVGIFQIFALLPGVSRSGITMTAGMLSGLKRDTAARFSFLVGAPLTFAAGIFKLKDLVDIQFTTELILYFGIGFVASAVSGYLCIKYFLKFLNSHNVGVFTIYRLLFAAVIVAVVVLR
ncbi:MAG: undecaprenyl-diphosphatase UppP [Candidatus Gracilibacteria bacterium]